MRVSGVKFRLLIGIGIIFFIQLTLAADYQSERDRYRADVENQRLFDERNRRAVLAEAEEFMSEINGTLRSFNEKGLILPLDMDDMNNAERQDHSHSEQKKIPVTVTITSDKAILYSESKTSSGIVGEVKKGDTVQVIARSREKNEGLPEWLMIRKNTGDEGWLEARHIRKSDSAAKTFLLPVAGPISSPFGYRVHPITRRRGSFHKGIDIAARRGTPVKAASDGTVQKARFYRNGYGNLVVIQHSNSMATYYGHLDKIKVTPGTVVSRGDVIGTVGSTGMATGPHLHFEVRRGTTALNPAEWLP